MKSELRIQNQRERIFEYLKANKTATGMELLRNCGVMCYTKRISELRAILPCYGYTILGEFIKVYSKLAGRKVRVKEYKLARLKSK